jgi:prevent-host-death family protein
MPRTVSASEAKNKLGSLVGWVVANQDEVIVESHGEPKAVIMAFDTYEELRALKEGQRRRAALDQLRQLRSEVRDRNRDIQTDEQAVALADRFVREVVDEMKAEGTISFDGST